MYYELDKDYRDQKYNPNRNKMAYEQRVTKDRFGNDQIVKRAKQVVNKKTGEAMPIYQAFVTINGQDYKIRCSNSNKEYKDGIPSKWISVTKVRKQSSGGRF